MHHSERRKQRSNNPREALKNQLAHVREEACLDALVLADEDGLVVAEAGDQTLCSELAAIAPILGEQGELPRYATPPQGYMQVRPMTFAGIPLYLASCSDSFADTFTARMDAWLEHTQVGIERILQS